MQHCSLNSAYIHLEINAALKYLILCREVVYARRVNRSEVIVSDE